MSTTLIEPPSPFDIARVLQSQLEMCRVVDTVLVDREMVYAPRHANDRPLLGLKESLNEYVRNGTVE